MKPERQRIVIAEVCGWFGPKHPHTLSLMEGWWSQQKGVWWCMPDGKSLTTVLDVPDYTNDLNAMNEAEKTLRKDQHWTYVKELVDLTGAEWTDAYEEVMIVAHASAAQRAEAFLKTLGKWEED